MTPDSNGHPAVGDAARKLGVREGGERPDVYPDDAGRVGPGKGMSVAPHLSAMTNVLHRVPRRLRAHLYGAFGKDVDRVFAMGAGHFVAGRVAESLTLHPDVPNGAKHGVVEPGSLMPLADYKAALAATRDSWVVDEPLPSTQNHDSTKESVDPIPKETALSEVVET